MRFFPFAAAKTCLLCHDFVNKNVCDGCLGDLLSLSCQQNRHCPRCGGKGDGQTECGACQQTPPPFAKLHASFYYDTPLRGVLHHFKHRRALFYAPVFADLMMQRTPTWLATAKIDAVLPMPLSRERLLERGFNQSAELLRCLAVHFSWTVLPEDAVCRRHAVPQSTLPFAERQNNVKGIFSVNFDVKKRNLLLIDDVFTSGASLRELARTLKKSGAGEIFAWTLARSQVKNF
ncbi:MAG: ComF family protein [Neisseria sp.]|nr:ComF family protein [Neisseria sp.]